MSGIEQADREIAGIRDRLRRIIAQPARDTIAVRAETLLLAVSFLGMLPAGSPEPAIVVESDGEIAFDWDLERRRTLTVSVGPGTVGYSGILGDRSFHGREPADEGLVTALAALHQLTHMPVGEAPARTA